MDEGRTVVGLHNERSSIVAFGLLEVSCFLVKPSEVVEPPKIFRREGERVPVAGLGCLLKTIDVMQLSS